MNEFMSLEVLATFAGLVTAVTLMVQFTKSFIKDSFNDSAVRLYTLVVSLVLTFVFTEVGTGIDGILLTVINSVIIAVASMGSYEVLADPFAKKTK